jgi:hypothetical protein
LLYHFKCQQDTVLPCQALHSPQSWLEYRCLPLPYSAYPTLSHYQLGATDSALMDLWVRRRRCNPPAQLILLALTFCVSTTGTVLPCQDVHESPQRRRAAACLSHARLILHFLHLGTNHRGNSTLPWVRHCCLPSPYPADPSRPTIFSVNSRCSSAMPGSP